MPFVPWVPTAGNAPTPLPVSLGGTGSGSAAAGLANLGGLVLQAATAVAGYTLVNGTGNVITWTAPNDGAQHRAVVIFSMHVTSTETGGAMVMNCNFPDGFANQPTLLAAGSAAGGFGTVVARVVQAGAVVSVAQSSALTAGAAVAWAEIWGL